MSQTTVQNAAPQRQRTSASPRRRAIITILLCLPSLVGGYFGYAYLASLKQPPEARVQTEAIYNVEVFQVERADLQEIVSGFGTARANREVIVSAQVSGEILEIHPQLKVGREVEAPTVVTTDSGESRRDSGDLLVGIDPRMYHERVAQAERRISETTAELATLKQDEINNARIVEKVKTDVETFQEEYERLQKLSRTNAATRSQLVRSLLELRQYEETLIRQENERALIPLRRSQIESRRQTYQADLELAKLDLKHTAVRPPFSGRLSEAMVERGQFVRAGDPLVRLTDDTEVEIPIPLALADYAKIEAAVHSGSFPPVHIAEHATEPHRWTGSLVRLAPEADQATRTVMAYVHVDNREQSVPLLPGTFVHARIVGPILKSAVVVPRDCIVGGQIYVVEKSEADGSNATTTGAAGPKSTDPKVAESKDAASETDVGANSPRPTRPVATVRAVPADVSRTLRSLAVINSGLDGGDQIVLTNLDIMHNGTKIRVETSRNLADELHQQRSPFAQPSLAGSHDRGAQDKAVK